MNIIFYNFNFKKLHKNLVYIYVLFLLLILLTTFYFFIQINQFFFIFSGLFWFLPFLILIFIYISKNYVHIRVIATIISIFIFFLSIFFLRCPTWSLWFSLDLKNSLFFFWLYWPFKIDNFNLIFIILTSFIISLCILRCWSISNRDVKAYLSCFFVILGFLNFAFSSFNILYFYVFFEGVLIPMYLVIGRWGSRSRRIRAAYLFFIYTFVTSLFMLFGILYLWLDFGSDCLNFQGCTLHHNLLLPLAKQKILFILFFIALASKIPMFPFHIWLPEAHVEAERNLNRIKGSGKCKTKIVIFHAGEPQPRFTPC